MKKNENKFLKQNGKNSQGRSVCSRALCAALCLCMLLFSFVGCTDEISLLKTDLENTVDELDALKKDLTLSQERIDLLNESNLASEEALASLKKERTEAAQKIDQLEETVKSNGTAAQQEMDALKQTNEELQQTIDSLTIDRDAALQEIETLKEQLQELQNQVQAGKIKIYIDQGHNPTSYHNSGASGNGLYEENLTFTIGKLLEQLLKEDGRFAVRVSRPTAATVLGTNGDSSLDARVNGAKDFGADYFISLHTNSFDLDTVNGIEVYVAEENSVSYGFGNALLSGLLEATGLYNRGMKTNPDLRVLKNATMPAALLEMGFISNAQDAEMLSQHSDLFAKGIYNGILAYFGLQPITPPATVTTNP